MPLKSVTFAVLGQLAFHPWSAYELIKEMKRNFHYFYPKAESGLYEILKKLEISGFATSEQKTKGKKERAVYTITHAGKTALIDWLHTEPNHFNLEFEGLLRVFLSKFGNPEALINSLSKVKSDTQILLALAEKVGNEYLSDTAPAQNEIIERAIIFDFLLNYGIMYQDWIVRTEKYLNTVKHMSEKDAHFNAKSVIKKQMKKHGLKAY